MILDSDRLLPEGYRFRYKFLWTHTRIDGEYRWLESVAIVQRLLCGSGLYGNQWADIGFADEVLPKLTGKPVGDFE